VRQQIYGQTVPGLSTRAKRITAREKSGQEVAYALLVLPQGVEELVHRACPIYSYASSSRTSVSSGDDRLPKEALDNTPVLTSSSQSQRFSFTFSHERVDGALSLQLARRRRLPALHRELGRAPASPPPSPPQPRPSSSAGSSLGRSSCSSGGRDLEWLRESSQLS
jgi:hypothetical protein